MQDRATAGRSRSWTLTTREVALAMPVVQAVHPGLDAVQAPRLSLIRRLAQRWDIRDGTLRAALSRASSGGWLAATDGRYRLGPASLEEAAAARALRARVPGYTLCMILEGADADLPRLREALDRLGFRSLQRSVWIGARTVEDRLGPALRRGGLEGSVLVFHCDEVEMGAQGRLSGLWGMTERAAELRQFHRRLIDYLTEPPVGTTERAWRCVEAAPVWYRVAIQDEPPFPLDLCRPDYPLDLLNDAWRAHLESTTRALVDLWRTEGR
jgi:DNA-binding transcriptional regulator PaaX